MFEGTLVESRGLVGTGTARWTALGSIALQCSLAAMLIALPLLRPEALPMLLNSPQLEIPAPKPPAPVVRVTEAASAASTAMSVPAASVPRVETLRGTLPNLHPVGIDAGPVAPAGIGMGWDSPGSALAAVTGGVAGPAVVAAPKKPAGPVRVPSGVSAGMLLNEIRPVYPAIAKAAHVEGTVVLEATISKAGRIESLRALSGPEMLRGAALEAVQAARYAPYKLNGEATEVQTTITVNFRLGS
jgi:protein TonB